MTLKWAEVIEDGNLSKLLPFEDESNSILSARKREVIDTSEQKNNFNRTLSTVEQMLLVNYFAIGTYGFQFIISNIEKFGIESIKGYAMNFNKAKFLLEEDKKKFVVLEDAKDSSIELFSILVENNQVSPFITNLYLNRNYYKKETPFILKNPTSIYKLNNQPINRLSINELQEEKELVNFLFTCKPVFRTEPNMLLFNDYLIENYAIRLLTTIYSELYFVVDTKTNIVAFLGAKN